MITTHYANILAGNAFGNRGGIPATVYLGLSTTLPSIDGTGATEPPTAAAYARIPIVNDTTSFSTPSLGKVVTMASHSFATSTAPWGTIKYVTLYDSLTGGNLLNFEPLSEEKQVGTTETFIFGAGDIGFTFGNCTP